MSYFKASDSYGIRNGHIIDGTGSPWYSAFIGIRAGRIAASGRLDHAAAHKTVDARGMVAPGFIDMLGQSEITSATLSTTSIPKVGTDLKCRPMPCSLCRFRPG